MFSFDFSQLNRGETVAVGLSGGEDSVCLLDVLYKERENLGIELVAINVEHGIRGESSLRDSGFCQKLCDGYGIKLYRYTVDAPKAAKENGYSPEQAARVLRYDCFFDCINKGLCDKVAVAHHLSDQAETILFNILRGSATTGAKGMSASAYDGKIVRPLLNVAKDDIKRYVEKNGLSYVTDESNADQNYTRNALRLKILPEIKRLFPDYESALIRFAAASATDDKYLYNIAKNHVKSANNFCTIDTGIDYSIFSRSVILAFKHLGFDRDYEMAHVEAVYFLCFNQAGKRVDLKHDLYAIRERAHIKIAKKRIKSADNRLIARLLTVKDDLKIADKRVFNVGDDEKIVFERVTREKVVFGDGLYFDLDKMPDNAILRYRVDGDVFTKFNGQTVTLKKFLTDKKVPSDEKKDVVVIAVDKTVYLIADLEISSSIKIDNDTQNIVKLEYIDENRFK